MLRQDDVLNNLVKAAENLSLSLHRLESIGYDLPDHIDDAWSVLTDAIINAKGYINDKNETNQEI